MSDKLYYKGVVPNEHRQEAVRRMLESPGGVIMVGWDGEKCEIITLPPMKKELDRTVDLFGGKME